MSRRRLGAIDRESVSQMRDVAEKTAVERRSLASAKAPPIGKVAGDAARSVEEEVLRLRRENDALQGDATAWQAAREAGLVIETIPLDRIDDHALSRDRRVLDRDGEAWGELKDSLRARGQQTPVELATAGAASGKYRLISGFRRVNALRELHEETGEARFAVVKALVADWSDRVEAMVAMVEENEIRQDVSFYERGRICCLAAEQGICASVDDAIQVLFASSSRNRRYKIRNFTVIHSRIGSYLDFPEQIGERLGARIAQALKEGREAELVAVLSERGAKFAEAAEEIALLEAFVARRGAFSVPRQLDRAPVLTAGWEGQGGLRAAARTGQGRVTVDLDGLAIADQAELDALLARIGAAVAGDEARKG